MSTGQYEFLTNKTAGAEITQLQQSSLAIHFHREEEKRCRHQSK